MTVRSFAAGANLSFALMIALCSSQDAKFVTGAKAKTFKLRTGLIKQN
jgi:hypothetical protein